MMWNNELKFIYLCYLRTLEHIQDTRKKLR